MKAFTVILKILAAAAAVVGAVYVAATNGDKIVAWAKKLMPECPCCKGDDTCTCGEEGCTCGEEGCKCAEEAAAEEAPAEEPVAEEVIVEAPAEEEAPVADEADFEG